MGGMVMDDTSNPQRERVLGMWYAEHQDRCGCEEPDDAFCAWPVPCDHTMNDLTDAARLRELTIVSR